MFLFEWKKILSIRKTVVLFLVFLFSSVTFFLQLKGVENGADTARIQKLYEEIEGKTLKEAREILEGEKKLVEDVRSREYEMEESYMKGEISPDEYLEYRDLYHECSVKQNAVTYVYERCLQAEEQGGEMVFDLYYNKLFDFWRTSAGLLFIIILMCIFVMNCEPSTLRPVLYATLAGKAEMKKAKLQVVGSASAVAAILFTLVEYATYLWFLPFSQTGMKVQGISVLYGIRVPVTVGIWLFLYVFIRIVGSVLSGTILFCILYMAGDRNPDAVQRTP